MVLPFYICQGLCYWRSSTSFFALFWEEGHLISFYSHVCGTFHSPSFSHYVWEEISLFIFFCSPGTVDPALFPSRPSPSTPGTLCLYSARMAAPHPFPLPQLLTFSCTLILTRTALHLFPSLLYLASLFGIALLRTCVFAFFPWHLSQWYLYSPQHHCCSYAFATTAIAARAARVLTESEKVNCVMVMSQSDDQKASCNGDNIQQLCFSVNFALLTGKTHGGDVRARAHGSLPYTTSQPHASIYISTALLANKNMRFGARA